MIFFSTFHTFPLFFTTTYHISKILKHNSGNHNGTAHNVLPLFCRMFMAFQTEGGGMGCKRLDLTRYWTRLKAAGYDPCVTYAGMIFGVEGETSNADSFTHQ